MRIGIFTEVYDPYISGVVSSISVLAQTLKNMQHDVYIVTPNLIKNKFFYDDENKIIYLPGINTGICNTKLASVYSKKAMDIIKTWNLDVIHSQTEFSVGAFSRIVSKKLNIPVVHTYHTLYEDYVYYVTHGHFDKTSKKIAIGITKYYCDRTCDELIVPTEKIRDLFVNKYQIKKKAHVIPSGIDTSIFELNDDINTKINQLRRMYNISDTDFIIGSLSRVAKEKSLDRIIKCMPDLILYSPNIKLMIVGDGPDLSNLKTLTHNLKLDDNVIFTGRVEHEDTPYYYNLFNIMTSFSVTETQGLTIIEALAASKPVLCINDDSFKEMVVDKYNGYLFKDEDDFVDLVKMLFNNPKLYNLLKLNAKNSIFKYSKEVFASDVLKVYSVAIQKNIDKKICNKI